MSALIPALTALLMERWGIGKFAKRGGGGGGGYGGRSPKPEKTPMDYAQLNASKDLTQLGEREFQDSYSRLSKLREELDKARAMAAEYAPK